MNTEELPPRIVVLDVLGVELPYMANPRPRPIFVNQKVLRGVTQPFPNMIIRKGTDPSVRGSIRP